MADEEYEGEEEEVLEEGADPTQGGEEGDQEGGEGGPTKSIPPPPKEVLPDEKPFKGDIHLKIYSNLDTTRQLRHEKEHGSATNKPLPTVCTVNVADASLPPWLRYVISDDFFYLQRVLEGKPTPSFPNGSGGAGGDEGADAAGEEGGGAAPADGGAAGGGQAAEAVVPFDANMKFVLEPPTDLYSEHAVYTLKVYVPPPEVTEEAGGDAGAEGTAAPPGEGAADAGEDQEGADAGSAAAVAEANAAASAAKAEEDLSLPPIILDTLTLAATLSTDALVYCLRSGPNAATCSLECFIEWTLRVFDDEEAIPALAALLVVTGRDANKRRPVAMDRLFAIATRHSSTALDAVVAKRAVATLLKMIAGNLVPVAPFDSRVIASVEGVEAYLSLLMAVPRTMLLDWMNVPPPKDDGTELPPPLAPVLGKIILDLRKRSVRDAKHVAQAIVPAEVIHARALPKELEGAEDGVITEVFSKRPFAPRFLRLYATDVALLALSKRSDTAKSFSSLLARKVDVSRPFWAPCGTYQLLWSRLDAMSESNANDTISLTPRLALVNKWLDIPTFLDFHVDTSSQSERIARRFADLFPPVVTESVKQTHPHFAGHLQRFQELCSKAHEMVRRVPEDGSDLTPRTIDGISVALGQLEQTVGTELLVTPELMYTAVEAGNTAAILWLANRGVRTLHAPSSTGSAVAVLEHCVRHSKFDLVLFLAACGANLAAPWEGGNTNALLFMQLHFPPEVFREISSVWASKEKDRGVDPNYKLGLLLSSVL